MIAFLRGRLVGLGTDEVWIDVGGVGFRVAVSQETRRRLPPPGETVHLHTRLLVRDDQWSLYGFAGEEERAAFDALITVSGVGPRVALSVLSVLTPEELHRAVSMQDVAALTRAPGVGERLARRLVNELREKLDRLPASRPAPAVSSRLPEGGGGGPGPLDDAREALEALGYQRAEAEAALAAAGRRVPGDAPAEVWVREALRLLGEGKAGGGTRR